MLFSRIFEQIPASVKETLFYLFRKNIVLSQ